MKGPSKYPIPFWTLTDLRLWLIALSVGALATTILYEATTKWNEWVYLALTFLMVPIWFVATTRQVWARIMDYRPQEIDRIPDTRAKFALGRLPGALFRVLLQYVVIGIATYLIMKLL
jgi:hypothetical protein